MRKLTFLVIVLASLYGGYWFVGARAIENGARQGLADLQTDGWQVDYADLKTTGFPSRFDTTLTDFAFVSDDRQFALRGPFVQVFALSYQPNQVIAVLPPEFLLDVSGQSYSVENERLRMSAAVKARYDTALTDITVEADRLALTVDTKPLIAVDRALAALRQSDVADTTYDTYLETYQVALATVPAGIPDTITRLTVDSALTFDRSLDRLAFDGSGPPPMLEQLELRNLKLDLADISVTADGTIVFDALGIPQGRITFRTAQWRAAIDLLVTVGLIDPGMQRTFTSLAQSMTLGSEMLVLPVSFQNGFMSAGPFPLGPAPRLRQ